jgi:hypothetical protein
MTFPSEIPILQFFSLILPTFPIQYHTTSIFWSPEGCFCRMPFCCRRQGTETQREGEIPKLQQKVLRD